MDGRRFSLYHTQNRAFKVFNRETKLNQYTAKGLLDKAFPSVPYSENKYVNVKGEKSPFDGNIPYWSERNSKLYDGKTSVALKKQNHRCEQCGLSFMTDERVHLHHADGNHSNWKNNNLLAIHESCHDLIHMSKGENQERRKLDAGKLARPDLTERGGKQYSSSTLTDEKTRLDIVQHRKQKGQGSISDKQ